MSNHLEFVPFLYPFFPSTYVYCFYILLREKEEKIRENLRKLKNSVQKERREKEKMEGNDRENFQFTEGFQYLPPSSISLIFNLI